MKCKKCNTEFFEKYSKLSDGNFCSKTCAKSYNRNQSPKGIKVVKCITCQKEITVDSRASPKLCKCNDCRKVKNKITNIKLLLDGTDKINTFPFNLLSRNDKRIKINQEQNYRCNICNLEEIWNEKILVFHLDHIDGNHHNNDRKNLRLICPNCHSQTETYCSKGIKIDYKHIKEETFKIALLESKSICEALEKLKISKYGGNYIRARRLIFKYNIEHLMKKLKYKNENKAL